MKTIDIKNMGLAMQQVQEAGAHTASHKPNNGSDPEQGLSPNAKKEKARTSGVGVDANKAIDMSFKAFKAMTKTAKQNGGRTPPGDKAIVKSTMAPAANQKTEAVQVDELSKGTMGSYVKKATSDLAVTNMGKGMAMATNKDKIRDDMSKTSRKRKAGISKAVDKMTKNEATAACTCENCTCDPCECGQADVVSELTIADVNAGNALAKKRKMDAAKDNAVVKLRKPIKGKIGDPVKLYKEKKKAKKDDKLDDGDGMDPVGQADADIDNDGDTDKTDNYLNNRRDAIRSKMKNKGKGKVGEKAIMHGGKSGDKKSSETTSVGEER